LGNTWELGQHIGRIIENHEEPWCEQDEKTVGISNTKKKSQTPTPPTKRKDPSLPKSMLSLLIACMKFLLLKVFVTILGQG
jgi:hypothetical protein